MKKRRLSRKLFFYGGLFLLFVILKGCGSFETKDGPPVRPPKDIASVPDAIPRDEPRSKYGNPKSYVINKQRYHVLADSKDYNERGIASWYGTKFHGKRTSSGEPYDMYAMTAAHKTLPLPTYAEVTNVRNGRKVVVKINDRGPFKSDRIIDLSYAAAARLGILGNGTGTVQVTAIDTSPQKKINSASSSKLGTPRYLQVGAFSSQDNAERLRTRLSAMASGNVEIIRTEKPGHIMYRVRIGPIPSASEADNMRERLAALGLDAAQIVVD